MRVLAFVVAAAALAAPASADERAYASGAVGFAAAPGVTSSDALAEIGVRVAPHLSVFGDVGQFHNLQPSALTPAVDEATAALAAEQINVTATSRVPARYTLGAVRYELTPHGRFTPFALGGVGWARMLPTATFTYNSGPLSSVTPPTAGQDVTPQIVSQGLFTLPAATNAFMLTAGGGAEVALSRHVVVNAGYRYSRVATDAPVHAQSVIVGTGYRF